MLDRNELNLERRTRKGHFQKPHPSCLKPRQELNSNKCGTFLLSCIPPLLFVIVLFPFDCTGTWLIQVSPTALSHHLHLAGLILQFVDRDLDGKKKRLTASSAGLPARLPCWHRQRGGPSRGFSGSSFGCIAKQNASF